MISGVIDDRRVYRLGTDVITRMDPFKSSTCKPNSLLATTTSELFSDLEAQFENIAHICAA